MERFRVGLVFTAHRLLYHSTLGSRVIKKMKRKKKNKRHGTLGKLQVEAFEVVVNVCFIGTLYRKATVERIWHR